MHTHVILAQARGWARFRIPLLLYVPIHLYSLSLMDEFRRKGNAGVDAAEEVLLPNLLDSEE